MLFSQRPTLSEDVLAGSGHIQLPLAIPTILGGLNQTVLTAMVMSVVVAMIGAEGLGLEANGARAAEIWFCGPTGLADALKRGLRNMRTLGGTPRFHQEAFEMR